MKNVPEQMLKALKRVGTRMKVKRKNETFAYYGNVTKLKVGDKVILSYQQVKIVRDHSISVHANFKKNVRVYWDKVTRVYWDKVTNFLGFKSINQMVLEYNLCFSVSDNHRAIFIIKPCDGTITREQKFREEKEYIEHKVI